MAAQRLRTTVVPHAVIVVVAAYRIAGRAARVAAVTNAVARDAT
jgi:hypothetical protein